METRCRWLRQSLWLALWFLVPLPATISAATPTGTQELVERGAYVLRAAGCITCHTADGAEAPFLAGGRAIESPFGTFYGPNITPDRETGIGAWTEADLVRALHAGRGPDGRHYYPVFPYSSYTRMRREDVAALWAYLQTVTPVRQENRAHELVWYARFRPLLRGWKWLHFRPGEFTPLMDAAEQVNRGAYLAALAHCVECHTPRSRSGGLDGSRLFAGTRMPDGDAAPNITPDTETGIGRWSRRHLARYLDMGMTRDGDFAGGAMASVIEQGTRHLTGEDRQAIVAYLLSLPPIHHEIPER
jgi:mono/diheme cytochrome c family protein